MDIAELLDLPTYTPEERKAMRERAQKAAKIEYDKDPNREDPEGVQDRMDAAVKKLGLHAGAKKK